MTGQGTVMFGHGGLHVTVIDLNGADTLYAEADRLLVHDASLQVGTMFMGEQGGVRGIVRGAVTGQGLFTTTLTGHGSCALLSHGGVMELPIGPQRPVHVDPQAYVAHRGQVENKLTAAAGLRDLVGRGSGEAFQLQLSGSGVVYVQASERKI
ncbi:AIM24 family protein [Actinomadura madurae]|uniref:AIM24 family protein n=1 Tax=Actinomadura madurae TaxID=1993 RepID=UPI0020D260C7|nr:AIM24 family protein [Actinomadura madurae]MCP9977145.1 AIM24 family protein [Actinomadura madurae]